MKKRNLALMLIFILVVSLFSACGGASDGGASGGGAAAAGTAQGNDAAPAGQDAKATGSKTPITVWFWGASDTQREAFQVALIDVYNATTDEFELVFDVYADTVDDDIPVALAAGAGPDVIYTSGPSFCNVYVQQNKIIDLTPYAEKYGWKDRLLPAYYDLCTLDGKLYSIPNAVSVGGVFYNKALYAENGWNPPETLADMEALMAAATEKGIYAGSGGNRGWRPSNDNFTSVMMNHFVSPTTMYKCLTNELPFNNPEMVAGVEKMYDWYQKGCLGGNDYTSLNSGEAIQLISDKRAVFMMAPSLYIQMAAPAFANNADELGFVPMPNSYAPDKDVYDLTVPCTFAISANSKHPDEAAKVLDIMLTAQFSQTMTERWPGYWGVPLRDNSAVNTSNMTGLSALTIDIIKGAAPSIDAGYFGYHSSAFFPPLAQDEWRNAEEVWNGTMSATDFLDNVDKAFQQDLANNMVVPVPKPAV